jgi:transposase-like protein
MAALKAENQRLRRELRRAEMEREILKKATAYFAKESPWACQEFCVRQELLKLSLVS